VFPISKSPCGPIFNGWTGHRWGQYQVAFLEVLILIEDSTVLWYGFLPNIGEVNMARISSVAGHLSVGQVTERIKGTVGFWRVQKWLVVYNLLVDPRPLREVARHVGLAWQTVRNLVSRYNRLGPDVTQASAYSIGNGRDM